MIKSRILFVLFTLLGFGFQASATELPQEISPVQEINMMDELDPFDPSIEDTLKKYDELYEQETGLSPFLPRSLGIFGIQTSGCVRHDCEVWAQVVKSTQTMYLYEDGRLRYTWKVSTGVSGHGTPNMDMHPNGRIYDRYTSSKFPGGDYKGLGNMPYAVFIKGGFAIHGTAEANWKKLGQRASHGCIRLHPDNGYYFNRLVRRFGVQNVWITVQD